MSYGRRIIYTDATEITAANVADEVRKAITVHEDNRAEIETLYNYYRGKTKVLNKEKEVRPTVNYKVLEAHPFEIVAFHKGYTFGEAIQYVRRENTANKTEDDAIAADINALNGYMSDADKAACDNELAEWLYVSGTSYRLTLPNKAWTKDGDEPPFRLYSLDPRQTFVVYSNDVERRPMMAVYYVQKVDSHEKVYSVYTDKEYFEVQEFGGVTAKSHTLGMIPVQEYPADTRLGVYEVVMSLIDALDALQSSRMDDVFQSVNSFLAILGGQLDDATYAKLNEWKTLCLPEGVDAKYITPTLSQSDVQTLKDDLYEAILTICGVPNRSTASSGGENGVTIIYRDGWSAAEGRAKNVEGLFKKSEKVFLRLVLRLLRDTVGTNLRLTDIETHFTRRNYDNIATKSQVLISMLNNPKIHPELAFAHCGMFPDPESAYLQSMAYYEEQERKAEEKQKKELERNASLRGSAVSSV
jgi:SPP1 family phage portal protein